MGAWMGMAELSIILRAKARARANVRASWMQICTRAFIVTRELRMWMSWCAQDKRLRCREQVPSTLPNIALLFFFILFSVLLLLPFLWSQSRGTVSIPHRGVRLVVRRYEPIRTSISCQEAAGMEEKRAPHSSPVDIVPNSGNGRRPASMAVCGVENKKNFAAHCSAFGTRLSQYHICFL